MCVHQQFISTIGFRKQQRNVGVDVVCCYYASPPPLSPGEGLKICSLLQAANTLRDLRDSRYGILIFVSHVHARVRFCMVRILF